MDQLRAELQKLQTISMLPNHSVEKFGGETGEDLKFFYDRLNHLFTAADLTEPMGVRQFPLFLKGRALDAYLEIPENIRTGASFRDVLQAFTEKVRDPYDIDQAETMLHKLQKGKQETHRDFMRKVQRLVRAAHPGLPEAQWIREVRSAFIQKLPIKLRAAVRRAEPASIEDTIRITEREETLMEEEENAICALSEQLHKQQLEDRVTSLAEELRTQQAKHHRLEEEMRRNPRPFNNYGSRPRGNFSTPQRRPFGGFRFGFGRGNVGYRNNWSSNNFQNRNNGNVNGFDRGFNRGMNNWRGNRGQSGGQRGPYRNFGNQRVFTLSEDSEEEINQVPEEHSQYNNAERRNTSIMSSLSKFPFFLVALLSLVVMCNGTRVTLNDCLHTTAREVVRIPEPQNCSIAWKANSVDATVETLKKKDRIHSSAALMCSELRVKICTSGFLKLFRRDTVEIMEPGTITMEECVNANKTLQIRGKNLETIREYDKKATTLDLNMNIPWFGENCETRSKYFLDRGEVHAFDGTTMTSDLGNMEGCFGAEGYCHERKKTVVWNPFHIQGECFFEKVMELSETTIVGELVWFHKTNTIEELSTYPTTLEEQTCLGSHVLKLRNGMYIRLKKQRSKRYFDFGRPSKTVYTTTTTTTTMTTATEATTTTTAKPIIVTTQDTQKDAEVHKNSELIESVKMRTEITEYELQKLTEKIKQLNEWYSKLSRSWSTTSERIDQVSQRQENGTETLTKRVDERLKKIQTTTEEENTRIHEKLAEIMNKTVRVEKKLNTLAKMNTSKTEEAKQITVEWNKSVLSDIQDITKSLSKFESDLSRLRKEVTKLQEEDETHKERLDIIQENTDAEMIALREEIANQQEKIARLQKYENIKDLYTKLQMLSLCTEQRADLIQRISEINNDPTEGMRRLLNEKDIVARQAGPNVYMLAKCKTIEVDNSEIFKNFEFNGTCYDRWPVKIKDNIMFILPATKDLVREAKEIPCHQRPLIITEEMGVWSYNDKKGAQPNIFDSTILKLKGSSLNRSRNARYTEAVAEWLTTKGKQFITQAEETTAQTLKTIGEGTTKAKEVVVEAYQNTVKVIKNTLATLWNWIKWILIYIGIPALIVVLLIGCCIVYVKIWFARKTTEGISKGIEQLVPNRINAVRDELELQPVDQQRTEQEPIRYESFVFKFIPTMAVITILVAPVISTSNTNGRNIPYIPIHVDGNATIALFDTGSSLTYCRRSTLRRINALDKLEPTNRSATAANGTGIKFVGTAKLLISIGNIHQPHECLVAEDEMCPASILLGTDILSKFEGENAKFSLNFGRRIIDLGDSQIPMLRPGDKGYDVGAIFTVKMPETMELPPRSDNLLIGRMNVCCPTDTDLLVEGITRNANLLPGRTLCNAVQGNNVPIRIINPGRSIERIEKGTTVATAEVLTGNGYNISTVYSVITEKVSPEVDWESKLPELPSKRTDEQFLRDKLDLSESKLNPQEKQELKRMILHWKDAFVWTDGNIGHYQGPIKHRIPFKLHEDPVRRNYPIPLGKQEEVDKQLKLMQEQGIIRPSTAEFCSPVFLVKKKDGKTWRFTVDYRGINKVTKPAVYILPRITDVVSMAAGKSMYTVADLQSAYFQVDMEESDIEKTAFATHIGLFEFCRVPMGLSGSPATFQRIMETMRRQMQATLLAYLDDIILMSPSPRQHLDDINELLGTLVANGLKLRLDKTHFARDKVKYLGFIISEQGIEMDKEKTTIITDFPRPRTQTDIRSFLGMTNYFRRFIKEYAKIAAPLVELTKKDQAIEWNEERENAFQALKNAITTAPVLKAPEVGKPFVIETDASRTAIAAVLMQADDKGEHHPVSFFSRRLKDFEQRYAALELEALAVCAACNHFRQFIYGSQTTLITDHRPLTSILQKKDLTGRLAKYQITMAEYDIEIKYRPGKQNAVADTLSRYPPNEEESTSAVKETNNEMKPYIPSTDEIREDQQKCPELKEIIDRLHVRGTTSKQEDNQFLVENGILYLKPNGEQERPIIVIPENSQFRQGIVAYFHNHPMLAAHMSYEKTKARMEQVYTWRTSHRDVKEIVTSCLKCQKRKAITGSLRREPLGLWEITSAPFERIHLDFLGPLPLTEEGNKYVLVFVDAFSKYAITVALPNQTAETSAKAFLEQLIAKHGMPREIVTDKGRNFIADTFVTIMERLGINHKSSTPYHKQANGLVERYNRTLEELLTTFVSSNQQDWDKYLPLITFAYNSIPHTTTKVSPFEVIYARTPLVPEDLHMQTPRWTYADTEDYEEFVAKHLSIVWDEVYKRLETSQKSVKERYDKMRGIKSEEVAVGQSVLLRKENPKNKLDYTWIGPYIIVKIMWPNVEIRDDKDKHTIVHLNRIKKLKHRKIADTNIEESDSEEESN